MLHVSRRAIGSRIILSGRACLETRIKTRYWIYAINATNQDANLRFHRAMASGGGGGDEKRRAMKRQRQQQKQNQPQSEQATKVPNDRAVDVKDPLRQPIPAELQAENVVSQSHHTIAKATSSSDPASSKFDSTSNLPTQLDLSSTKSLDWQSSYASINAYGAGGESNSILTSSLSRFDSFTPPTTDGIMTHDISSSLLDLKDLFDPNVHLPYAPQDWKGYEPATPLSDELMARIGVVGKPITTADYMRQALTHPLYGYYTNPPTSSLAKSLQNDIGTDDTILDQEDDWDEPTSSSQSQSTLIGPGGDFVTAPEISHVFGHCICLWFVTQWQALNKPANIQLVELGPGRGTLISDIVQLAMTEQLRPTFGKAIHTIHLIEASTELRREQEKTLQETLGDRVRFEFGPSVGVETIRKSSTSDDSRDDSAEDRKTIRVQWHNTFGSFRHDQKCDDSKSENCMPVFMVLQEFLDALPVHVFERTDDGWRERLVDVVSREENPANANYTPLVPRLRQVLAPDVTPAVELFFKQEGDKTTDAPVGTVVEICPEAVLLVQDMAQLIEDQGGVALVIDYGKEGTSDSLRAFANHQQVPLMSFPGQVDVTADVDFYVLKHCLQQKQKLQQSSRKPIGDEIVCTFGPVTQGEFLMRMGASDMVIALIEQETTTNEQANAFTKALKYLVMPEHMGERYKVLALGRKRDGIFAPPGLEN